MQTRIQRLYLIIFCLASANALATPISIPAIDVNPDHMDTHDNTSTAIISSQKQIKQQGSISGIDFFNKQGVVQVENHSALANQTSISIHGFGNNAGSNTLMLINGIPLTSFTNIGPNLNSILIDNIKQIVIKPGSYGVRYGDQAVGGVVNILTTIPTKAETKANLAIGNDAQRMAQFFLSHPFDQQFNFSVSGSAYHTNHDQLHDLQNNYNINTLLTYKGERDNANLNLFAYETQLEIPRGKIWGEPNNDLTPDYNHSDIQSLLLNLQNHFSITNNWLWTSNLSTQHDRSHGKVNIDFNSRQSNWLWQNKFHYKHWLLTGFDLQTQYYRLLNDLQNNHVNATVEDIYTQATIPIYSKLDFILGGRYAHQYVNAHPTPSQKLTANSSVPVNEEALAYHFNNAWQAYLKRDTNYRFAKANEKIWVTDNVENLKTQTGVSYQSGIKWQERHDNAQADIYLLDLDHEIAYDPIPTTDAPFGKVTNLPPTRRVGLDLSGNLMLNRRFSLNLQTSTVNAYFRSGTYQGKKAPSVSAINTSTSLTYENPHHWYINLTETAHSPFYASFDLANQGKMMPGYFLTNMNFHKEWHAIGLGLQVNNLLNKHYVRFADYFPGTPDTIEYFPADGISVLLKLTIRLA